MCIALYDSSIKEESNTTTVSESTVWKLKSLNAWKIDQPQNGPHKN